MYQNILQKCFYKIDGMFTVSFPIRCHFSPPADGPNDITTSSYYYSMKTTKTLTASFTEK